MGDIDRSYNHLYFSYLPSMRYRMVILGCWGYNTLHAVMILQHAMEVLLDPRHRVYL